LVDLEIRHLQLVRAVAETGTLTRAAVTLHLTQSALSHQLRDIESRLGAPLFLRVGKRLTLTPAGERLLLSATDVLATIERTEDVIRQMAGDQRGVLRMTTECYTCYHWLPPLLTRYRRAHPRVDVRIDAAATNDPVPALLEGRLDVAVLMTPVRDRRLVTRLLFSDELLAVVAPTHPFATRPFVEVKDFAPETILSYKPKEESTVYQRVLRPAGVAPANLLVVQLTEAIVELAKAGLGVGLLARWAVEPHLRAGTLAATRITREGLQRTWCAATLKDLARVPYVREFIDLLPSEPPRQASLFPRTGALRR
jgi:LysR family transcriptional regulator for metE and metH